MTRLRVSADSTPQDWTLITGPSKLAAVQKIDTTDTGKGGDESYIQGQGEDLRFWVELEVPDGKSGRPYIPPGVVIHRALAYADCKQADGDWIPSPITGTIPDGLGLGGYVTGVITQTLVDVCFKGAPDPQQVTGPPGPFELMLGATIAGQGGFAGDDTIGDDYGVHFSLPTWNVVVTEYGTSHVHNGKGVRLAWDRSYLDNMKIGIRSRKVDISGGAPEPVYLEGGTDCTWLFLDVEWGDRYERCSQCCCCCLCNCPTVIIDAGTFKIGINLDPDGGPFFFNPKFCFRVCNQGPHVDLNNQVDASCWFYCYPDNQVPDPVPPGGCVTHAHFFDGDDGVKWQIADAVILAGETLPKGCLTVFVSISARYPDPTAPLGYLDTPGIVFKMGATTLIQCTPYHLSTVAPGDETITTAVYAGGVVVVPQVGTQGPGDAACWDQGGGNYTVTCKPAGVGSGGTGSGYPGLPLDDCSVYE